ncbi:hypothetical protein AB0G02_18995 [Actinosynnema sp. NPDC023658]
MSAVFGQGATGVGFFFLLSGFALTRPARRRLLRTRPLSTTAPA